MYPWIGFVRNTLLRSAVFSIACFIGLSASFSQAEDKPNVLFIAIDDLNDWL
jgi:hypothetical protein